MLHMPTMAGGKNALPKGPGRADHMVQFSSGSDSGH